jgi:hypothetical protein
MLVDVAGIEPATPCLQRQERKSISLVRLVLFCVVVSGFGADLSHNGPKLDPSCDVTPSVVTKTLGTASPI